VAFIDSPSVFADQATAGIAGRGAAAPAEPVLPSVYLVPDWVRVRSEDFGLLFYDTRSTRLTFVRSGDRLAPPPFTGARRVVEVLRPDADSASFRPADPAAAALRRLLDGLVAKGLLVRAPGE
jgi:putative mycofactocin binding protein MftB